MQPLAIAMARCVLPVPVPPTGLTLRCWARKSPPRRSLERLIDRHAFELEVVDVLGRRQLGDGDLALDRPGFSSRFSLSPSIHRDVFFHSRRGKLCATRMSLELRKSLMDVHSRSESFLDDPIKYDELNIELHELFYRGACSRIREIGQRRPPVLVAVISGYANACRGASPGR